MYSFPVLAITYYHKLSGLKQCKFIILQFWRSESKMSGQGCVPPESPRGESIPRLFFFLLIFLIYLFLAALGFRCCAQAFSSCSKRGLLFVAVRGLLIAVAFLVA